MNRPEQIHGNHSVTRLVYQLVLCPKYRAAILEPSLLALVQAAIRRVCTEKGIKVLNVGTDKNKKDHLHIHFQSGPIESISGLVGFIKGKSAWLIRLNMPCLRLWCRDAFWSGGYSCDSVGTNWRIIGNYIRRQGATA